MKKVNFSLVAVCIYCLLLLPTANSFSQSFQWAKSMGGTDDDESNSIAVDGSGNIYTTGFFTSTADFDPGPETFNLTSTGQEDFFISKLDSSGNFIWAKSIGGTDDDESHSIVVDGSGNVYTTGGFWGTIDFDPGDEIFNLTSAGWEDIFVYKLGGATWVKK